MNIISNFNGIEVFFILILGLILFGPEKLPIIAKKLGYYARVSQRIMAQFMDRLNEETGVSDVVNEVKDTLNDTNKAYNGVKETVQPIENAVKQSIRPMPHITSSSTNKDEDAGTESGPEQKVSGQATSADQQQVLNDRVKELEKMVHELRSEIADRDSTQRSKTDV